MKTTIALVGNPNSGKTTLFNQLTGNHQYVGNWPGVTVERKTGTLKADHKIELVDLPGIYSLSPYSNEEVIARNFLSERSASVILDIVDASNLERNLYLTTQLMEFGIPVVVALNQMDIVKKRGYKIKSQELSEALRLPVVEISALKGEGLEDVVAECVKASNRGEAPIPIKFAAELETYIGQIDNNLPKSVPNVLRRFEAIKVFERDKMVSKEVADSFDFDKIIIAAESAFDDSSDAIITNARYKFITDVIPRVQKRTLSGLTTTEKVDRVLTNRFAALPIFVVIIALVYYISISTVGTYFTDWVNDGVFGDGWFVASQGRAAYDEAAEAYDGAVNDIDAYLAAAQENGVDAADAETLATYIGSDAEEDADTESSEYAQALSAFEAAAKKADLTGTTHVVDEDTAETDEHKVSYDDFVAALEVEEPDPYDYGLWVPGIPVLTEAGLAAIDAPAWLTALVQDGIIAGVGAVLGFVPQIMVLFFLLAILEGSGYMARVTFILDRIFRRFGLSGKTFIPMLVGTGCGVPGVMASRTIESESSRHLTVMTTTFMPCSAKLPVIALISTAFFGGAWWVAPSAYFLGIASIIVSGIMLKKTKPFLGETTPYIMELPEYRLPRLADLLRSMWERAWAFIRKAGTIILLATIVVWYLSTYGIEGGAYAAVSNMDNSFLAYFGNAIAWIFAPLGLGNWECASAITTGLLAKENLVGTMAVLYSTSPDLAWTTVFAQSLNSLTLGFGVCAAFSYLVFNLLCAPCFAAMGAIKREMGGFNKWFWAAIGYEMGFAWCVALMFFQFSKVAAGGPIDVWFVVALLVAAVMLFMLFRPYPKADDVAEISGKTAAAQA
jgi:ferrous iron transport protein B